MGCYLLEIHTKQKLRCDGLMSRIYFKTSPQMVDAREQGGRGERVALSLKPWEPRDCSGIRDPVRSTLGYITDFCKQKVLKKSIYP